MGTINVKNDYMLGRQNENILYLRCIELEQENKYLKKRLDTYENPEDMTLFYMWCSEKVKDENKQLKDKNKKLVSVIKTLEKEFDLIPSEYVKELEKGSEDSDI